MTDTTDTTKAPAKKVKSFRRTTPLGKGRHLTSAEKSHIIELYKSGTATIGDLAKRYKKSHSAIIALLRKNNVKKGETAEIIQKQVQEEIAKSLVDEAAVIANRIKETKEEHYKMAAGLSKLIWKTIADAKKDGRKLDGAIATEIKSYKNAAEALRITRAERYAILNVSAQDEADQKQDIPQLVIQELTSEEIQRMNQAQRVQMDDVGDMWDEPVEDISFNDDRVEEGEDDDEEIDSDDYTDMEEDDGSLSGVDDGD